MDLDHAYDTCTSITRRRAQNFYYAFLTLPKPARQSICALYSYARELDDIADDEDIPVEDKATRLHDLKRQFHESMHSEPTSPVFLALKHTINRYDIPVQLLDDIWEGVTQDLSVTRYDTFDDLKDYCYLVASAVGLASLRIFGYNDIQAEKAAVHMGVAMQLTNILRDIAEDASRDRIYLPLEDLDRFGLSENDILARTPSKRLSHLIAFQIERAEKYYEKATDLFSYLPRRSRPCVIVMLGVYHRILKELSRDTQASLYRRISIPKPQRALLALQLGLRGLLWKPPTSPS